MKIFLTILFLSNMLHATGQIYKFEGTVYAENGKKLPDALVVVRNSQDSIRTDLKGYFSFASSEQKDMLIDISKKGFRPVNIYISYSKPESSLSRISLCSLCKYDSSNRTCPVCKCNDKVLEIVYGLPLFPLRKDVYYAGYCEVTCCDPKYYCMRDKTRF